MVCSHGNLNILLHNMGPQHVAGKQLFYLRLCSNATPCVSFSQGLHAIHSSFLGSHGNLTSTECYVDSHWVVHVSGMGLSLLKSNQYCFMEPSGEGGWGGSLRWGGWGKGGVLDNMGGEAVWVVGWSLGVWREGFWGVRVRHECQVDWVRLESCK